MRCETFYLFIVQLFAVLLGIDTSKSHDLFHRIRLISEKLSA